MHTSTSLRNAPPPSHPLWLTLACAVLTAAVAGCDGCADAARCGPCGSDAGDAGDGGAGGGSPSGCGCDGGPPDGGAPPPYCDDGNPCTIDVVEGEGCRFDAVADGAICEDGDLCTLGDRCMSGQCASGDRSEGELALLGRLDDLGGRYVATGPGRFVVVTREELFRSRVQVVARTVDGLERLASWQGTLPLVTISDDEILVDAFDGLVAVAARQSRTLRFFSASDAEVTERGEIELSGQILSMVGHGERLWLCTRDFGLGNRVLLVDLADPDAPVEVGGMSLGNDGCGSTAITGDGHRIYVNTTAGVRVIDAEPLGMGGDPTLSDIVAPTSGVNVSGSHLLLTTTTGVRILTEPELDELVVVPVSGVRAASLFGDRLLVEGNRTVGGEGQFFAAMYDALGGGEPALLDEVVFQTYLAGSDTSGSFRSATDGATLIRGTRLYDLTEDAFDEVRVPELLPMRSVARTGDGVRIYDRSGAANVDVSDAANPAYVAGGAFGPPHSVLRFAIDDSAAMPVFVKGLGQGLDDPTRVTIDTSNPYYASPLSIHRWALDDAAALVSEDTVSLPHQGRSQLLVAGDFLYRFRTPQGASTTASLAAYWLPGVESGDTLAPSFEIPVPANATGLRGFDVDPRARIALVSTQAVVTSGFEPALLFYDLSTSPPEVLGAIAVDILSPQVRVAGQRAVAFQGTALAFYELGQGEVARITVDGSDEQMLAFDGQVAYLSELHVAPGVSDYELAAYTFGSTEPPVRVEVNAVATSYAAIDDGLAVGFEHQLVTVRPQCVGP